MENAYADTGITSGVLSDLVKIPTKDFEEKFREWMERDDVTRSLQAKLRRDLITNFNKTALGRQIMSQTTMTTSGVYGGAKTQRLTLSPVVLALNTLVAEFLYAENCHYTLSVFCTEVPFRNTLPDFDERSPFRFAATELNELLGALVNSKAVEQQLRNNITHKYTTTNTSLLLLLLQYLLANLETKDLTKQSEHKFTMTKTQSESTTSAAFKVSKSSNSLSNGKDEMQQLNKYLFKLSRKMETMMQQFETLQRDKTSWKTRRRPRRAKILNHSFERMKQQLRKMSQDKMYNKQMQAVLTAINVLGNQFENCAQNFAQIYEDFKSKSETDLVQEKNADFKQTFTQTEEKSYADWLHEMCETRNGKKFLNRVENSLTKALNIQKAELQAEVNRKMEHEKTLLKIRYKQKLIDHIAKQPLAPVDGAFLELKKQLQDLQMDYKQLLQKIKANENEQESHNKQGDSNSNALVDSARNPRNDTKKLALHQVEHIHSFVENLPLRDPTVDNLLKTTKQRLMALDEESNQMEMQVSTCLARLGKQTLPKNTQILSKNTHSATKSKKTEISTQTQEIRNAVNEADLATIETLDEEEELVSTKNKSLNKIKSRNLNSEAVTTVVDLKFENAISNAKKTFFENEEKRKQQIFESEIMLYKKDNLLYKSKEPYYERSIDTFKIQSVCNEQSSLQKNNGITNETDENLSTESTQYKPLQTSGNPQNSAVFTTTNVTQSNKTFDISTHRDKSKNQLQNDDKTFIQES